MHTSVTNVAISVYRFRAAKAFHMLYVCKVSVNNRNAKIFRRKINPPFFCNMS